MSRARAALILSAALLAGGVASSQTLVGGSRAEWSALNPGQRSALAPLERDWNSIPAQQQQKWLELANRYPSLPADERARMTQRMTDWSRLSPQDRAKARLNFQEARQASRDDRQQHWADYNALPPEQRRALAERGRPGPAAAPSAPTNASRPGVQPVSPMVVQRGAGATTNLVSKPPAPPLQQQAGLPKVVATPGFVEPATLLPQRGPQGAGAARRADADDKPKPKPKSGQ